VSSLLLARLLCLMLWCRLVGRDSHGMYSSIVFFVLVVFFVVVVLFVALHVRLYVSSFLRVCVGGRLVCVREVDSPKRYPRYARHVVRV